MGGRGGCLVWLFALGAAGCVAPPEFVECGDLICPLTMVCTAGGCAHPDDAAPCVDQVDGDACAGERTLAGTCHEGVCHAAECGNAIADLRYGEVCDDGNQLAGDGCSSDCLSIEVCGNGVADFIRDEECDAGIEGLSGDGCSSTCRVELAIWRELPPASLGYRQYAPLAYDARRNVTVMFGGQPERDSTWEWTGASWIQRTPITKPPPRELHAMAFDARRGRTVMFGGSLASGETFHDTWEWDGVAWLHRSDAGPGGRAAHTMAYDEGLEQVVLFGGLDDNGVRSAETWAWDGTTWTLLTPLGSPPGRSHHALAYDPNSKELVVYGGLSASGSWLRDTWAFDGVTWRSAGTQGPVVANMIPAMVHDDTGLVLVGDASGEHVWRWSDAWAQVPDPTLMPPGRQWHRLAYDSARQRIVMYGGEYDDLSTWEFDGTRWWEHRTRSAPPVRDDPAVAYDARRGRLVLYGGRSEGPFDEVTDTWEWDGLSWELRATLGPVLYQRAPMTYDAGRGEMVLYEGSTTWIWNGSSWASHAAPGPGSRASLATAYDAARGRVVLFGGSTTSTETWLWDGGAAAWTLAPTPTLPPPRRGHVMAYDAVRERVVMYGGSGGGATLRDVWEWDGTAWADRTPTPQPPERSGMHAIYDPLRQRVLIHGGTEVIDGQTTTPIGSLEWDGVAFTTLVPTVEAPIGSIEGLAFHAVLGRAVMVRSDLALWGRAFEVASGRPEVCAIAGQDTDADGIATCADPDCFGRCAPSCPPGAVCDPAAARCGDGTCGPVEDYLLCPGDCPVP